MVKRPGERARASSFACSPTHHASSGNAAGQDGCSGGRPFQSSPEPAGKLDIARWAAAAAEQLQQPGAAANNLTAAKIGSSQGGFSVPRPGSPQSKRAVGIGSVLAQQQQQQQQLGGGFARPPAAATSPASGATAADGSRHSSRSAAAADAQAGARGGALSPLFAGGGMWSTQGKGGSNNNNSSSSVGSRDPARTVADLVGTPAPTTRGSSPQPPAAAARALSPGRCENMSSFDRQFVEAAATAATNRAAAAAAHRAPSPLMARSPGLEHAVMPRRSISPGPTARMGELDASSARMLLGSPSGALSGSGSPKVSADLEARLSAYARQLSPEAIAACPPLLRERLQAAYAANLAADAAAASVAASTMDSSMGGASSASSRRAMPAALTAAALAQLSGSKLSRHSAAAVAAADAGVPVGVQGHHHAGSRNNSLVPAGVTPSTDALGLRAQWAQHSAVPAAAAPVAASMAMVHQQQHADVLVQQQYQQQQHAMQSYPTVMPGSPSPDHGGSCHDSLGGSRRSSPVPPHYQASMHSASTTHSRPRAKAQAYLSSDAGEDESTCGLSILTEQHAPGGHSRSSSRPSSRPGSAQGYIQQQQAHLQQLQLQQQQQQRPASSSAYYELVQLQQQGHVSSRRAGSRCSTEHERYSPEPAEALMVEHVPRPLAIKVRSLAPLTDSSICSSSMSEAESSLAGHSQAAAAAAAAAASHLRNSQGSSNTRASAKLYQAYAGQAELSYNPKAAVKVAGASSYLHGDVEASRRSSIVTDEQDGGSEGQSEAFEAAQQQQQQQHKAGRAQLEEIAIRQDAEEQQRVQDRRHSHSGSSEASTSGGDGSSPRNSGGKKAPPSKAPSKIHVEVVAGGGHKRCCSQRVLKCVLLPLLLLLLAGAGIGAGVAVAMKGKGGAAGVGAGGAAAGGRPARAVFGVAAHPSLPGVPNDQRCKLWFGSSKRVQAYQTVFAQAYSQGLSLQPGSIQVTSISCDGSTVWQQAPAAASFGGRAARLLLSSTQLPLYGSQQQQPGQSDVTTRFAVTADATEPAACAALSAKVASLATEVLTVPLTQFFQASVWVQPAALLEEWTQLLVPAPAAALPIGSGASAMLPRSPIVVQPAQQQPPAPATAAQPAAAAPTVPAAPAQSPAAAGAGKRKGGKGKKAVPAPAPPAPAAEADNANPADDADADAGVEGPVAAPITLSGESVTVIHRKKNKAAQPAAAGATKAGNGKAGKKKDQQGKHQNKAARVASVPAPAPMPEDGSEPDESADYHMEPLPTSSKGAKAAEEPTLPYAEDDGTGTSVDPSEALDPSEEPVEPPPPAPAPAPAGPAGSGSDDSAQWVEFYDNAPTCAAVPTIANSVYDGSGRLWGFEKKAMCVFRATSPQWAPVTWKEAPTCSGAPTASSSVYDESGKLWGWQDGRNCAFKAAGAKPAALTWDAAPVCPGQPAASSSMKDVNGRKWGWSGIKTCAFRKAKSA